MTKKKKIFWIVFSALIVLVAMVLFMAISIFFESPLGDASTGYENDYYSAQRFWWIPLAFLPLLLIPFIIGILRKNRVIRIVAVVIMAVLGSISYMFLDQAKSFSTEMEYLETVESAVGVDFPEGTTILIQKQKTSSFSARNEHKILWEGVIRPDEIFATNNVMQWSDSMDSVTKDYISPTFSLYCTWAERFACGTTEDNLFVCLAYEEDFKVIYATCIQLK